MESQDFYMFIQMSCIQELVGKLACPTCGKQELNLEVDIQARQGFASKYSVFCNGCEIEIHSDFFCKRMEQSKSTRAAFQVNTRAVLAFQAVGCGYSQVKEWCSIMNMPYNLSHDSFSRQHDKVNEASTSCFEAI